jgi:hypothetical protein
MSAEMDQAATRRSRLVGIKLRALVAEHLGSDAVGEPQPFGPGAALVHEGAAWVLLDDRPGSRLGAALAWAVRSAATQLHVIADEATGTLARRAIEFAYPVSVWHAEGRGLWPAVAEPLTLSVDPPIHHRQFRQAIVDAGADPVEEHGVLAGEVHGLEVSRVVDDPYLGTTRLEVGVGVHDRQAFAMLHGDEPAPEALARVVEVVRRHRQPGADQHPLNRLARERLLRWQALQSPALVGAAELLPVPPPVVRANLKDPVPAVAAGTDQSGVPLVAVFSTGVDLDLVPFAADARLAVEAALGGGRRRLLVVTPARDQLPVTSELAAMLRRPAVLIALD